MPEKNKLFLKVIVLTAMVWMASFKGRETPGIRLQNLRCERLSDPEGIDVAHPRLSWEIAGDRRAVEQVAYRILVASTPQKLAAGTGDLWDSGKVLSGRSVHVAYAGQPLTSRRDCYWKVKVWTSHGETSWSKAARWSMGLLHHADWKGRWIGLDRSFPWDREEKFSRLSARYFRKEFRAPKVIRQAKVYIMGLGLYELYINGKRVGDQVLAPAPTDYTRNIKYNTFDVTGLLTKGENAIGVVLGNGRFYTMRQAYKPYKIKTFGYPKMLLNLDIEYSDGSRETFRTDNTWKVTADGPIRTNNEYDGEEYDARKEMPGWQQAGFDDSNWLDAEYVQEPGGAYQAQMNENMAVMKTIKPKAITQLKPGTYIMDMGQNMVGWVRMELQGGKAGDQVTLRFAEVLQDNGALAMDNLRDALVTDRYTLKGDGREVWEPSFVYHGFRYVEITGYPGIPTVADFQGRVVYDAMQTTGTFETSNPLINQIYQNAYWGILGNYKGMPVDCPQRNERQPWLGDRSTGAYGESFIFGNGKLYAKWLDDIRYAQKEDGSIPDVAPAYWRYYSDNMTWPGTYLLIADMLYRQYGDIRPIEKHYPSMKKWLEYMRVRYMDDAFVLTKDSYGDWCAPPPTIEAGRGMSANVKRPSPLISTAYYYYYLQLMQRFAELTGHQGDVEGYRVLADKIRAGFHQEFFHEDSLYYGDDQLTDNLLPLYFGMVPAQHREAVFAHIAEIITGRNGGHLSTGTIGTQWLMRTLTENGAPELAYRLASNSTYPSWGYMVKNGATTIWELWNGNTAAPDMNSYNHVMLLGDLVIWYFEHLAGIKSSPGHPGFKQVTMKPVMPEGLDFVDASYHSVHGLIRSNWERDNNRLRWDIMLPGNTKAIVFIPARGEKAVREGGNPLSKVEGVKFLRMEGDRAVLEIGSGRYSFTTKM